MTRSEIIAFTPGFQPTYIGGLNYAVPTLAWLQGPFWSFFRSRYGATNSLGWKFRWECRDFARAYACAAQECWADTVGDSAPDCDALTVGEIWFIPDASKPLKGHAICPVITDNGLQFIDPQLPPDRQIYQLSDQQLASRYFLRW